MAKVIYELAEDISLTGITVYRKFADGVHKAYRLNTDDGYVMYDTSANDTVLDEDGNEVETINFCTLAYIPVSVPVDEWTWVAVQEEITYE